MTNLNNQIILYFASDGSLKNFNVSNHNSKYSCVVCNNETSCEPYNLGLSNCYYQFQYLPGSNTLAAAKGTFKQVIFCKTTLTTNGEIELKEDKCFNVEGSESLFKTL